MLIKDIRYPKLKALAKKYYIKENLHNIINDIMDDDVITDDIMDDVIDNIIDNKDLADSFLWDKTPQNRLFWELVNDGNYEEACKIFDWDSDTIKEDLEVKKILKEDEEFQKIIKDLEDYRKTPREFDVSPIINHSDNTNVCPLLIDKPEHYSKGIDTFQRMEANCTKEECLAFAKGNIDKYNWRTKGQDLEDFKKIIVYAEWAIKLLK